jgi:tetratricopeptide (TPR) repeat protein
LFQQGKLDKADDLLDELPNYQPGEDAATMFRLTGDRDAQQGRWAKALKRFTMLQQLNRQQSPTNFLDDFRMATILVDQGENMQYEAFRKASIKRYLDAGDPLLAARALRLCLLSPASTNVTLALQPFHQQTARLIETNAVKMGGQQTAWCAYALALMAYRSGDYVAATNWCDNVSHYDRYFPIRDVCVDLVRVMSLAKLGDPANAQATLGSVRTKIDLETSEFIPQQKTWHGYWFDWVIVRILLREANTLVENEI